MGSSDDGVTTDVAVATADGQAQSSIRKSCRFCRSRKIKCSGDPEGCKACHSRTIECHYDPTATMGRPRKFPRASDGAPVKKAPPKAKAAAAAAFKPDPSSALPATQNSSPAPTPSTLSQQPAGTPAWQPWLVPDASQQSAVLPWMAQAGIAMMTPTSAAADGHDLATLADASNWAASADAAYGRDGRWSLPSLTAFGSSNGLLTPTTVDRMSIEASIAAQREERSRSLKRKASEMSEAALTGSSSSASTPPIAAVQALHRAPPTVSDVFTTTDLASTFKAFKGKSIAAMATAHLEFLSKEASPTQPPAAMMDDRTSDPALTRRHYIAAFKRIASSSSRDDLLPSERAKFAASWDSHGEMICDCINIAMTTERSSARVKSKYISMLRQNLQGELLFLRPHDPLEAPVDNITIDEQIRLFADWHASSPLASLINDGLLCLQLQQGTHDRALLCTIVGWQTFGQNPFDAQIDELFDYAERTLLARPVGIDHLPTLLGTVQSLILLAAYRAERMQVSKCWALFSVAHGLGRAGVRQYQQADLEARRRNSTRTVPVEQQAMEENLLSCCWMMALFGSWCFLSTDMPKTSVLDMIDRLPALPTDPTKSASYQLRSALPSLRTSDEPLAFAVGFFSESSGALGVIARLWSRGTAPVPESEMEPEGNPTQLSAGIAWRRSLYGDPRLSHIGIVGPIISQMLMQDAVEIYESTPPTYPAIDPQWSQLIPGQTLRRSLLASAHAALALYRLTSTGSAWGTEEALPAASMRTLVKGLSLMADAATAAVAQPWPALPALKSAAVSRICAMTFPGAIALLGPTVERARSSTEHFAVVVQFHRQLQTLLGQLEALASTGIVSPSDAAKVPRILSSVDELRAIRDARHSPLVERSTSVPSFFDASTLETTTQSRDSPMSNSPIAPALDAVVAFAQM